MNQRVGSALLMCVCSAATAADPLPFPLPPGQGAAEVDPAQHKTVHLKVPMATAERFYRQRYAGRDGVSMEAQVDGGGRAFILRTKDVKHAWGKAVLTAQPQGALLRLTPHYRLETVAVEGSPPPWIQVVIHRSAAVKDALEQDHLARRRGPR